MFVIQFQSSRPGVSCYLIVNRWALAGQPGRWARAEVEATAFPTAQEAMAAQAAYYLEVDERERYRAPELNGDILRRVREGQAVNVAEIRPDIRITPVLGEDLG